MPTNPSASLCAVCGSPIPSEPLDAACSRCGHLEWFTWEDLGDAQILKPRGNLMHAEPFDRFMTAAPPRPGARFVLDLADVPYISSEALSRLISLRKKLLAGNGRLVLRHMAPDLVEIFRVTRIESYFEIER